VIRDYGADSIRTYEMFMGPLEVSKPWSMQGVDGVHRFLNRTWRLVVGPDGGLHPAVQDVEPTRPQQRILHQTLRKVTEDLETMSFNTAISQMMVFVNAVTPQEVRPRSVIEPFVLILSPFAPHIAEELWRRLGHERSLAHESWPACDPELAAEEQIEIPVQVNGKVRARVRVAPDTDQAALEAAAMAEPKVQSHLTGKTVRKVIVVPNRLVNIVAT
jgi:leucyl-tRNA synthetase